MADPLDLLVITAPGLSARLVQEPSQAPGLAALARKWDAATIVPVLPLARPAIQATYLTGHLPAFHGVLQDGDALKLPPFWEAARKLRPLPVEARGLSAIAGHAWPRDEGARCRWFSLSEALAPDPATLDDTIAALVQGWPGAIAIAGEFAVVDDEPAGPEADPLDRPLLLTHGLDQPKACLGACEVAAVLQRALTGERLHDRADGSLP